MFQINIQITDLTWSTQYIAQLPKSRYCNFSRQQVFQINTQLIDITCCTQCIAQLLKSRDCDLNEATSVSNQYSTHRCHLVYTMYRPIAKIERLRFERGSKYFKSILNSPISPGVHNVSPNWQNREISQEERLRRGRWKGEE